MVNPVRLVELVHEIDKHILEPALDEESGRFFDRAADGVVVVKVLVLARRGTPTCTTMPRLSASRINCSSPQEFDCAFFTAMRRTADRLPRARTGIRIVLPWRWMRLENFPRLLGRGETKTPRAFGLFAKQRAVS